MGLLKDERVTYINWPVNNLARSIPIRLAMVIEAIGHLIGLRCVTKHDPIPHTCAYNAYAVLVWKVI